MVFDSGSFTIKGFQGSLVLGFSMLALPLSAEDASVAAQRGKPAPRLQVAAEDVVSTHTVRCGNRDVTFCKIRPLSLPPIPEPMPPVKLSEEEIRELRQSIPEEYRTRRHLFVGASAYVVRDEDGKEQYYSRVRYWLNNQEEAVDFWTNANFVWLSGQIAEFEIGDENFH